MKMLMSDYEVTLVNDNMQEFYVRFKGPEDSKSISPVREQLLTLQHPSKVDSGKFTLNYPTSTRTRAPASAL